MKPISKYFCFLCAVFVCMMLAGCCQFALGSTRTVSLSPLAQLIRELVQWL